MSSTPYDYSSTMADGLRDGITVLLAEMGQEVDGKPAPSRPLVATRAIARALGGPGMRSVAEEFVHWYNGKRLTLPPEDRYILQTTRRGQEVWVIESAEGYTMLFADEY